MYPSGYTPPQRARLIATRLCHPNSAKFKKRSLKNILFLSRYENPSVATSLLLLLGRRTPVSSHNSYKKIKKNALSCSKTQALTYRLFIRVERVLLGLLKRGSLLIHERERERERPRSCLVRTMNNPRLSESEPQETVIKDIQILPPKETAQSFRPE